MNIFAVVSPVMFLILCIPHCKTFMLDKYTLDLIIDSDIKFTVDPVSNKVRTFTLSNKFSSVMHFLSTLMFSVGESVFSPLSLCMTKL